MCLTPARSHGKNAGSAVQVSAKEMKTSATSGVLAWTSKRDAGSLVIETRTEGGKTTAFKTKSTVDHLTFTTESGIYKKETFLATGTF